MTLYLGFFFDGFGQDLDALGNPISFLGDVGAFPADATTLQILYKDYSRVTKTGKAFYRGNPFLIGGDLHVNDTGSNLRDAFDFAKDAIAPLLAEDPITHEIWKCEDIVFDVFGWSRGAVQAMRFANAVPAGEIGLSVKKANGEVVTVHPKIGVRFLGAISPVDTLISFTLSPIENSLIGEFFQPTTDIRPEIHHYFGAYVQDPFSVPMSSTELAAISKYADAKAKGDLSALWDAVKDMIKEELPRIAARTLFIESRPRVAFRITGDLSPIYEDETAGYAEWHQSSGFPGANKAGQNINQDLRSAWDYARGLRMNLFRRHFYSADELISSNLPLAFREKQLLDLEAWRKIPVVEEPK